MPGMAVVAAIVGGLIVGAVVLRQIQGKPATYGGAHRTASGGTRISVLPRLPGISVGSDSLYPANDPWKRYLADEQTCPGGEKLDAPLTSQLGTMACLVNYARRQRGLLPLTSVTLLNQTSTLKAEKIARCRDFNHTACGTNPAEDARVAGYEGSWGENLYIAGGRYGSPRVALDAWLNSPGHRENLFRSEWRTQGISVEKLSTFGRERNMTLWVNQFGT